MKIFIENLLKILKIKSHSAGLEISQNFLRYASFDGKELILKSVKLPPDTILGNEIKNYKAFVESLNQLRLKIFNNRKSQKHLNVSVCLNLNNFYIQVFNIPFIDDNNLKDSINLNIQMISPQSLDKIYNSFQIISKDLKAHRIDVLSAFVNKNIINDVVRALLETKFVFKTIEPYATSLVRFLKNYSKNFDDSKNYLILSLNDVGLSILISKNGNLYFEYVFSWNEIIEQNKKVLWSDFEKKLIYHLHQVINFYNSKFNEAFDGIFIVSPLFNEEIQKVINSNFNIKILNPDIHDLNDIRVSWFGVLGAEIRSKISFRKDKEINLTGFSLEDEFIQRQTIQFFGFWRLVLSITLGILILVNFIVYLFLNNNLRSLVSEKQALSVKGKLEEVDVLRNRIEKFNNLTALINKIENNYISRYFILDKINKILEENNIELVNLSFDDSKKLITMSAKSDNEENIVNFKKALEGDQFFQSIDLPLQNIKSLPEGKIFSISFSINLSKRE